MPLIAKVADQLAHVVLAGPLTPALATQRVRQVLGRCPRWLGPVLKRLVAEFGEGSRPRRAKVAGWLRNEPGLGEAVVSGRLRFPNPAPEPLMCPAQGPPETWKVPAIRTVGELAVWLGLAAGELEWFADVRLRNSRTTESRLGHYRYRWILKRDGSARLIQSPKLRLKLIQRRVLSEILGRIPPHEAAHGFRAGRSIRTFVVPHIGREIVLRFDLRDFFPSVTRARIVALLLTVGYPEPVAWRLAGICTARVPRAILTASPDRLSPASAWFRNKRYAMPHLPQGAPTSPALANLAAYLLDRRLAGLATAAGASYTRYADDLVFSGGPEFARGAGRFSVQVGAIVLEEGFELNGRKTRVMRRGVSQRAAGIVLNEHPNISRRDFDALKAILHNCAKLGVSSQNRDTRPDFRAHLLGRIAHLTHVNPDRGGKLRRVFDRIAWI